MDGTRKEATRKIARLLALEIQPEDKKRGGSEVSELKRMKKTFGGETALTEDFFESICKECQGCMEEDRGPIKSPGAR